MNKTIFTPKGTVRVKNLSITYKIDIGIFKYSFREKKKEKLKVYI